MEAYQFASPDDVTVERVDTNEFFIAGSDTRAGRRLAEFLADGGMVQAYQAPSSPTQQQVVDGALTDSFRRALIEELAFRFELTPLQLMNAIRDRVQP